MGTAAGVDWAIRHANLTLKGALWVIQLIKGPIARASALDGD